MSQVTTTHQYIKNHLVKPTDKRMIIGTIHPHKHEDFDLPFYYGNVGSFWSILKDAFPHLNFSNYNSIINTLSEHNTWITDMISQCDRHDTNVTQDKFLFNLKYNTESIDAAIRNSQIDTIYFTSRFGKNNAAKLFIDQFNLKTIVNFNKLQNEFNIPANRFGKSIKCIVLYSPSGEANRGISRSAAYLSNKNHYLQFEKPVSQFKVEFYRNKFAYFNN